MPSVSFNANGDHAHQRVVVSPVIRQDLSNLVSLIDRSLQNEHRPMFDYACYRLYSYGVSLNSLNFERLIEKLQIAFEQRDMSFRHLIKEAYALIAELHTEGA